MQKALTDKSTRAKLFNIGTHSSDYYRQKDNLRAVQDPVLRNYMK